MKFSHDSSPVVLMRSARVFLCFGLAASFCLGSGRTRSGGGAPTRVRALALTALILENVCFFGLLIKCLDDRVERTAVVPRDYAILLPAEAPLRQDCMGGACAGCAASGEVQYGRARFF